MSVQRRPGQQSICAGDLSAKRQFAQISARLGPDQPTFAQSLTGNSHKTRHRQDTSHKKIAQCRNIFGVNIPDGRLNRGRCKVMNPKTGRSVRMAGVAIN